MPKECFKCGISEEREKLFDVIVKEGIVKMCKECASDENIPLIKKRPTNSYYSYNKFSKRETVYERLSRMSGVDSKNKKSNEEKELLKKQEATLKSIVNKNYQKNISKESKPDFLINNFHWIIMRKRRLKHITQEQLAKEINEPEAAIKMIEKGIIPRGIYNLIEKLEKYFDVRLTQKEFSKKIEKPKKIAFDSITTKELTIADLKEMQMQETEFPTSSKQSNDSSEDLDENYDDDLIFEDKEDYFTKQ